MAFARQARAAYARVHDILGNIEHESAVLGPERVATLKAVLAADVLDQLAGIHARSGPYFRPVC